MTDDTISLDEARRRRRQKKRHEARGNRPTKQSDILVDLALAADLFHAPDGTPYADITVRGHRETWPVRSKGFRRWLSRQFFEATDGSAPPSESMQSALNVIEAKAHFDGPERAVFVRVGGLPDGRIYIDIGDTSWRAIEVSADGWRVVEDPHIRFRRSGGALALPMPASGGSVEALRSFLNVRTDDDFTMVAGFLVAALRDCGPFPVLVLVGEQGSTKSTATAILRSLVDPNSAPLRALPREQRDLFIQANNAWLLAYDNLGNLAPWISDTLCRIATGGGFAVRALYTDQDEVLFDATRPVVLNGITDIVGRPDLADRSIFLTLEPIEKNDRRSERELWAAFELERPRILGGLLDAMAHGLKELPRTHLDSLPRMADFATWATACEGAIWEPGTFMAAYDRNQATAVDTVVESDPVMVALLDELSERSSLVMTSTRLLEALAQRVGERATRQKGWPGNPRALSQHLRMVATLLRKSGFDLDIGKDGDRFISITPRSGRKDAKDAKDANPRTQSNGAEDDIWHS